MAVDLHKLLLPLAGGPQPAIVAEFGGRAFNCGIFGLVISDYLGESADILVFGRTLGVRDGLIRLGPLSMTSAYGHGRIVLDERDSVSVIDGDDFLDFDHRAPGVDIPMIVGLLVLLPALTLLPMPYAIVNNDTA